MKAKKQASLHLTFPNIARTDFTSEREHMEHLFALYEKMRAPLEAR